MDGWMSPAVIKEPKKLKHVLFLAETRNNAIPKKFKQQKKVLFKSLELSIKKLDGRKEGLCYGSGFEFVELFS